MTRTSRPRRSLAVAAATVAALAVAPTAAPADAPHAAAFSRVATVELTLPSGGRAGTMTLVGASGVTAVRFFVSGLPARTSAVARVHTGTRLGALGTRVAALPPVAADRRGNASGTGFVTAGAHHVSVESVADGGHLVVLTRGGKILAWGRIPPAES